MRNYHFVPMRNSVPHWGLQRNSVPLTLLGASEKEISHIKDRTTEVAKRGVMYMATKIEVHDDYCIDLNNAEIESILSQITALITNAVLRGVYQTVDAA